MFLKHQKILPFQTLFIDTSIIVGMILLIDIMIIRDHQKLFDYNIFGFSKSSDEEDDDNDNDNDDDDIDQILNETYDEK
jgi:hypothetical protein